MILLLLFLISGLLIGAVIAIKLKFLENFFEKAAAAIIMGLSFSTLFTFFLSFLLHSLSSVSIGLTVLFNFLISYYLIKKYRIRIAFPSINTGKAGTPEIILIILFLLMAYFNSLSIYDDTEGNIWAISNTWADYALHIGIINSFAMRDNFPPVYPNLAETQMRYPFLVDFLSSIFVYEGVPIAASITIPNLLLILALISLTYAFLRRFAGNKEIAAIAMMLFFLNGNLGFAQFIEDYGQADDKGVFMRNLHKAYSFLPEQNIQFMNLTYSVFIPQRAALMGFPIVMLLLILLWRIYRKEAEKWEFLLGGVLISIIPLIHASSFGVAGFIAFGVFLMDLIKKRRFDMNWVLFGIPLLLIALPQLAFIDEQVRTANFFGPQIGWMSRATSYGEFVDFWWRNIGVLLVVGTAGIALLKRDQLIFALPFLSIFLFSNLLRFQPWEWDNVKVLMYWLLMLAAIGAIALYKLKEFLSRNDGTLANITMGLLIFISIFSGVLTFIAWNSSNAVLWNKNEIRIAEYIIENTEKDALFLTAGKHNHLVYTLAGRQILAGYDGHLWSHGLAFQTQSRDSRIIFLSGDIKTIRKWGVDYVFIGPQEINEWNANPDAFINNPDFTPIYGEFDGNYAIFKVNEPS